jgi:hypothetical protein
MELDDIELILSLNSTAASAEYSSTDSAINNETEDINTSTSNEPNESKNKLLIENLLKNEKNHTILKPLIEQLKLKFEQSDSNRSNDDEESTKREQIKNQLEKIKTIIFKEETLKLRSNQDYYLYSLLDSLGRDHFQDELVKFIKLLIYLSYLYFNNMPLPLLCAHFT